MSGFYAKYSGVGGGGGSGGGVSSLNLLNGALTLAGNPTAGLSVTDNGVSALTINQQVADATHNGYLSSANFVIFNAKQPAGNYITALTGDGTAAGPGSVALTLATVNSNVGSFGDGANVATFTVNAKGLTTAAGSVPILIAESQVTNLVTDLAAKQTTTLTSGNILVGSVGNVATSVTMSGDATIVAGGALTLATVNANTGSFGSATNVATFTADGKGRLTAAGTTAIQIAESQVTNLTTDLAAKVAGASNLTTAGLVPYISASGTLNQDSTFLWDSTNHVLNVTGTTAAVGIKTTNTGTQSTTAGSVIAAFSDPGAAIASGNRLGQIAFGGSQDAAHTLGVGAFIAGVTSELWSGTARGTGLQFFTTPSTTLVPALALTIAQDKSATFVGAISASNLTGTNSGNVTFASIGAVPNASGASLSTQAITLQPANASFGGVVTTIAQSFAGVKTFTSAPNLSSLTASLPLQLDASKNIVAAQTPLTTGVTGILPVANGGTGVGATYTNGQLLIGNTTGGTLAPATLTAGTGIIITNGAGAITVASSATSYTYVSQPTTLASAVPGTYYILSNTSFTATLPTAVGIAGQSVAFQHNGTAYTQIYTFNTTSAQTINGLASGVFALYITGETVTFISDGANWNISNRFIPSNWTAMTPASAIIAGMGTLTGVGMYRRRVGDSLELRAVFTSGTSTAVEARLPFIQTGDSIVAATNMQTLELSGLAVRATTGALALNTLMEPSVNYITFGVQSATAAGFAKVLGTTGIGSTITISLRATIPIQGWQY